MEHFFVSNNFNLKVLVSCCSVEPDEMKNLASVLNRLASEKQKAQKVFL